MTTYTLTVSTDSLGLGVLNGARVVVDRKRTQVTDVFNGQSLSKNSAATNSSGIATILLEPDDGSVYHELKIFDLAGILVYSKIFIMPPQAISLSDLPVQDIISASAAQAVNAAAAAIAAAESIIVATKKFSTYAEQMAYTGNYVDGQKCDVLSYYALGDGGFIPMYWSASSTAVHNGGTVRQPTSVVGAGRWLAVNSSVVTVAQFGAKGNDSTDDYNAITNALIAANKFGTVIFGKTSSNIYRVSQELKFFEGQKILGQGGTSAAGTKGTQILLTATANGVMSPDTPATTKYAGTIKDIYFNAQGFGDYGLSLYNCSYFDVSHCAAASTKASGCGLLLDSNVSLQCYFNIIRGGRFFATGTGGAAIRFTRGANANMVIGGKCGSSYRGMEFLTSSAGNIIIGTDFEDNADSHVYADAPSNIFQNLHMENCPIGYWLTTNATNTARIATSYASTVTTQVQDYSKTGSVLDTRIDTVSTKGDLRFGAAKFISNLLSSVTTLDYDPDLVSGTSGADVRFYLNTNTTGNKRILMYKGDGTSNIGIILNAKTGDVQHSDLLQENGDGGGVYRKTIRRAVAPTTGTWTQGDICNFTSPVSGGYIGAVCTASGTPGTWKNYGLIT